MNGLRASARARRALGLAACIALTAALALAPASSCDGEGSSSAESTGAGGAAGAAGASTTTPSSSSHSTTSSSATGGCEPGPIPEYLPEGWVEYTDWSCQCRFYVPGSAAALPPPVEWVSCPEAPGGIECRMAKLELGGVESFASNGRISASDGKPVLELGLGFGIDYAMALAGELDGPTTAAIAKPKAQKGCSLSIEDFREGKWILAVDGDDGAASTKSKQGGAIGGSISELHPPVLLHELGADTDNWICSRNWVVRWTHGSLLAYPWSMSQATLIASPAIDPEGYKTKQWPRAHGDAVFWATGTLYHVGINVWDPAGGPRAFIRWPGDYDRGAANLGTDGVDMVWSEGEGHTGGDEKFDVRNVMTAPFTTDPEVVAATKHRLRSQQAHVQGIYPWEVGCGYGVFDGGANNVLVVRLSDGWSWLVPTTPTQDLYMHKGVTCDEVFVSGTIGDHLGFARIRLDSLGPGMPPD